MVNMRVCVGTGQGTANMRSESAVLVVDSLALRRAGIVSFLTPWADHNNLNLVPLGSSEDLVQSVAVPLKLILLVIGARRIADTKPQNLIASLQEKYANTPIVLICDREEPETVVAAYKAGVHGFIPMNVGPHVAVHALTFIMGGGTFFPPTALQQSTHVESSARVVVTNETRILGTGGLTPRQQEVLELLRQGGSNKLIGRQLMLRESTVKVHIRQIMRKLGVRNRTQAALSSIQLKPPTREKSKRMSGSNEIGPSPWRQGDAPTIREHQ